MAATNDITRRYHVFLSHNNAEKPAVEYLARQIRNEGFDPWLDKWELPAGKTWQDGIELGLRNAKACAVIVGPAGITKWHREEILIANQMRVERVDAFPVIPVLLPGITAADCEKLPQVVRNTTWVKFTSLDDREALLQLIAGFLGKTAERVAPLTECPYRGLRFFDVDDSSVFLGRKALTEKLLDAVRPQDNEARDNRFVGILGPSGSGKSSLARAGLLAGIRSGALLESENWPMVICRPGKDPIEGLATALLKTPGFSYGRKPQELVDDLLAAEKTLHLASTALLKSGPRQRLVVFVDQFEELFTQCESEALRGAFIRNLLYGSLVLGGQIIVVLAMRSDFYGRCAEFAQLATALSQPRSHFLVGPMEEYELEQAISEPARLAGARVDPQVVQRLLMFSKKHKGCLPLVQDVLTDLWRKKTGNVISLDGYKEIGGVEGSLGRRADEVYETFDQAGKEICERVFLRLVLPAGGAYVKRRMPFSELLSAGGDVGARQKVEHVVQSLCGPDARVLLTESDTDGKAEPMVEIVHESLIDGWKRLGDWLAADHRFQFWRSRVERAKDEWLSAHKHPELLLRGPALIESGEWIETRPQDLNADEHAFIEAGIAVQKEREREEGERQQDLLDAQQSRADAEKRRADAEQARAEAQTKAAKRSKLLAIAGIAVVSTTAVAVMFSLLAGARRAESESDRLAAIARNQVAATPDLGVLLALHAVAKQSNKTAFEALQYTLQAARRPLVETVEDSPVTRLAYSRDGQQLASAHADGVVRVWQVSTGKRTHELKHPDRVNAVAFTPDAGALVTACVDGIARIWKIQSEAAEPIRQLSGEGEMTSVDVNRDGTLLAGGYRSGKLRIWRLADAAPVAEHLHDAPLLSVRFHPANDAVAAGYSDGAVLLWTPGANQSSPVFTKDGKVADIAFSPDGKQIAVASGTTAFLSDLTPGRAPIEAGADPLGIAAVAISPSGRHVGIAGLSGTLLVFDVAKTEEMLRLVYGSSPLSSAAFQPKLDPQASEIFAVGGRDGVRVFELNVDTLKTQAREKLRATKPVLTAAQCTQYLGGRNCSTLP